MTDLSPIAKDVLDAVKFEVNAECDARWIAVAAFVPLRIKQHQNCHTQS